MRSKKSLFLVAVLCSFALLCATAEAQTAAKPTVWKVQCFWSPVETTYKVFEEFCNRIKVLTGGRLELHPYSSGAIVPNNECLDAVRANVLQAMVQAPTYWSGKEPAFAIMGDLVAAWREPWEVEAFYNYHGGLDFLNELYKPFGVYSLGVTLWGMESIPSKRPIRKMEDFKGLKIRAPQGMQADLISRCGASVVSLPGGEVYTALDKGVIDATDWGTISMNEKLAFHSLAKFTNYPGFHSMGVGDFSVNQKEWDKLPEDIKQILKTATHEMCLAMMTRVGLDDLTTVASLKTRGIVITPWSDEDLARVRVLAEEVWDAWAKKSPMSKRAIDLNKKYLKMIGRIK
jgi:TRAP-type mannitol/chloroaromatic compound transport system substrate-binding protein